MDQYYAIAILILLALIYAHQITGYIPWFIKERFEIYHDESIFVDSSAPAAYFILLVYPYDQTKKHNESYTLDDEQFKKFLNFRCIFSSEINSLALYSSSQTKTNITDMVKNHYIDININDHNLVRYFGETDKISVHTTSDIKNPLRNELKGNLSGTITIGRSNSVIMSVPDSFYNALREQSQSCEFFELRLWGRLNKKYISDSLEFHIYNVDLFKSSSLTLTSSNVVSEWNQLISDESEISEEEKKKLKLKFASFERTVKILS